MVSGEDAPESEITRLQDTKLGTGFIPDLISTFVLKRGFRRVMKCVHTVSIREWRWMAVQEMVTIVGVEWQFNLVVVCHSKGWHHSDLVIVNATYLRSNHHQQRSVWLCAGTLYVTANSGCHFQIYHIWIIKHIHFSWKIDYRSVVFVLFPVFWMAFLFSVSWPYSTPSKFIFILRVIILV